MDANDSWMHVIEDYSRNEGKVWEHMLEACQEGAACLKFMAQVWNVDVRSIAEIGVYRGELSRDLRCHFPKAHLYLVDPWVLYEQYLEKGAGPACREPAKMEGAYQSVSQMFQADPQVTIIRKFSAQAAADFDGELDLLYIDGNHSYEFVKEDILAWMPKVRSGGIVSGHDYDPENFPGVVKSVKEIFGKAPLISPHSMWMWQKNPS